MAPAQCWGLFFCLIDIARQSQARITDGPFAETREILAGFNLIEVANADEAMRIAQQFPWSAYGSIKVRPLDDLEAERV